MLRIARDAENVRTIPDDCERLPPGGLGFQFGESGSGGLHLGGEVGHFLHLADFDGLVLGGRAFRLAQAIASSREATSIIQ